MKIIRDGKVIYDSTTTEALPPHMIFKDIVEIEDYESVKVSHTHKGVDLESSDETSKIGWWLVIGGLIILLTLIISFKVTI